MGLPLSAYIGLRYTGSRKGSQMVSFLSAVAMLGLIVGVGLLLTVLSVMNGFDRELRRTILSLVPQGAIYHEQQLDDWRALRTRLEARPDVLGAAPFIRLNSLASYRGKAAPLLLYGVDPEAEAKISTIDQHLEKSTLSEALPGDAPRVILGRAVADELGVAVGESLMMVVPNAGRPGHSPSIAYLEISDILNSGTELDNTLALTSLPEAAELAQTPGRVTGMRLQLADLFDAPSTVYDIVATLGNGYYGSDWTRTHGNLYQAIHMSKNMVTLLMSLIVAIAAFNVVSALVMVVVDKQGDIAILRTLGASTGRIMRVFMVQGLTIGVIGTALGVVLGLGLSLVVEDAVLWLERLLGIQFLKSDVYPLSYLPSDIRSGDVVQVAVIALALSFAATLYPAWRASRVRPAEALRYE